MSVAWLFYIILRSSVMATFIVVIILCVKWLFKTKFSPRWHYGIWLLLIFKLIVPYGPISSMNIFNPISYRYDGEITIHSQQIELGETGQESNDEYIDEQGGKELSEHETINGDGAYIQESFMVNNKFKQQKYNTMEILAAIWILGITIMFSYMLYVYIRFMGDTKNIIVCDDRECIELVTKYKVYMGIKHDIQIYWSLKEGISPCVMGILKPRLIFPINVYGKLTHEERTHILLHELAHVKRRDNVVNIIALFLNCLHWFNPMIWYAFHKMRNDCELACDYYIVKRWNIDRRRQYGNTLLHTADLVDKQSYIFAPMGMSGNKEDMKRRVENIIGVKPPSLFWIGMAVVVFIAIGLIGLTNTDSQVKYGKNTLENTNSSSTKYTLFQRPNLIYVYNGGKLAVVDGKDEEFEMILEMLDSDGDNILRPIENRNNTETHATTPIETEKYIKQKEGVVELIYNNATYTEYKIGINGEEILEEYSRLLFPTSKNRMGTLYFGNAYGYDIQSPIVGFAIPDELESGIISRMDWKGMVIKYDGKYRLVEGKKPIYQMPDVKSNVVRDILPNSLVEVINAVKVGRDIWLEVIDPVYDTPLDTRGWIQEKRTVEYTEKNRRKVQGDIFIDEGTPYYELDVFDREDRELKKLDYDLRGRIEERKDGYVRVFTPGAWEFWVEEKYIVYLPIE